MPRMTYVLRNQDSIAAVLTSSRAVDIGKLFDLFLSEGEKADRQDITKGCLRVSPVEADDRVDGTYRLSESFIRWAIKKHGLVRQSIEEHRLF